jgi:lysophospholipase L1-like esterase
LVLTGLWAHSAYAAAAPKFNPPKEFIVGVGDSLMFGFQEAKFALTQDPADFTTGFIDVFAGMVQGTAPGKDATVINFGCPGETTASLLSGPCPHHASGFRTHVDYDGAQIDAATSFLESHRGKVGTILVDIGSNDLLALITACGGFNLACVIQGLPGTLATISANYDVILARLRAAAPNAEIIVVQLYNPFVVLPVIGEVTNELVPLINDTIAASAGTVRGRLANPFPPISLAQPQPLVGCTFTEMCPSGDIHLSDPGYALVAGLIFTASGYERFVH